MSIISKCLLPLIAAAAVLAQTSCALPFSRQASTQDKVDHYRDVVPTGPVPRSDSLDPYLSSLQLHRSANSTLALYSDSSVSGQPALICVSAIGSDSDSCEIPPDDQTAALIGTDGQYNIFLFENQSSPDDGPNGMNNRARQATWTVTAPNK